MRNIFKIHIFFYVFAFICILTGYFKDFIYVTLIIFIHELGHIIMAYHYKWNIDKVIILPIGEVTIFNEKINRPIKEEFLITIMGPLFQSLLFLIFRDEKIVLYNLNLLVFNLLPIIPLDGSKIFNLFFNKIYSFKKSHIISIIISLITIIICLCKKFNLVIILTLIFLLFRTIKDLKNHRYIFNKFLFERYLYNFNFKKEKIVKRKEEFKRDHKHTIKLKKYITEKEFLTKLFDK